jgi:hypothetical protein
LKYHLKQLIPKRVTSTVAFFLYLNLSRYYLTKQWIDSDFETQIKEIAHHIRTIKSNQNNKQNKVSQIQPIQPKTIDKEV